MIETTDSSALAAIGSVSTELHHFAVVLPEPANRHLLNEMILIFHLVASSHFDERKLSALGACRLLHQTCSLAILHRNETGGADHVCQAQLILGFLRIAVGEAEISPEQFKLLWTFGPEMPYLKRIFNLRYDKGREDRIDHDVRSIVERTFRAEDPWVLQPITRAVLVTRLVLIDQQIVRLRIIRIRCHQDAVVLLL